MTLPLNLLLFSHVLEAKTVSGDLNNVTDPGFYFVQSPVNGPMNNWAHLLVNKNSDGSRVLQIFMPDQTNDGLFVRLRNDNNWQAWHQVYFKEQVDAEVTRILTSAEF